MKALEVAWAAGIFEGEGCIYLKQPNPSQRTYKRYASLTVYMTDGDVVQRFGEAVGMPEKVKGPFLQRGNRKPLWRFRVAGRNAEAVIRLLLPYLGERRTRKANEVLEGGSD